MIDFSDQEAPKELVWWLYVMSDTRVSVVISSVHILLPLPLNPHESFGAFHYVLCSGL
jgi:hypothetical protein